MPADAIADVPEMAFDGLVNGFEIGDGGLAARAPVDHVLAAIDQALFPEAHEGFANGAREACVHGEAFARPIDAGAFAADLLGDAAAVLFFPLPDATLEFFAAKLLARDAFGSELALDHHLRGDAGVIHAGKPKRDFALHAMPAHGDIHDGVLEHVADVKRAGDVGRRDDERKVRPGLVAALAASAR